MGATAISVSSGLAFTLSKAITGFDTVSKPFGISGNADLDPTVYTDVYAGRLTIASGANTDVDLFGSLLDLLGNTVAAKVKLAAMTVKVTGGVGCDLVIKPGTSTPLVGFIGGTTPTLTIPAPAANVGSITVKWPTFLTVSVTSRILNFAGVGGSGSLTVDVAFALG